jgi:hypothetical protein
MPRVSRWMEGHNKSKSCPPDGSCGRRWFKGESSRGRRATQDDSPPPYHGISPPNVRRALWEFWWEKSPKKEGVDSTVGQTGDHLANETVFSDQMMRPVASVSTGWEHSEVVDPWLSTKMLNSDTIEIVPQGQLLGEFAQIDWHAY